MKARLITAPEVKPITGLDLKDHLRIPQTYLVDDNYLDGCIAAATLRAESIMVRKCITQTWEYVLDGFPCGDCIRLPFGSLQSVTSVKYTDEDGTENTFTDYTVDTAGQLGRVCLNPDESWPADPLHPVDSVVVRFVCGYGDAATDVPEAIKMAIQVLAADSYKFRETGISSTMGMDAPSAMAAEALLFPYKIWETL
jgi:uncharacterized phiE125 gp8 family phage protein